MSVIKPQEINLDFSQNYYRDVTIKQNDINSRTVIVTCTNNGIKCPLDRITQTCNIKMMTPDGRPIYNPTTILSDGRVQIDFTEQMVLVGGIVEAELQVVDSASQEVVHTMNLSINIENNVYPNDAIIASPEFDALNKALLAVQDCSELVESVHEIEENEKQREENEAQRTQEFEEMKRVVSNVDEHYNTKADEDTLGHVKVDNVTIIIDENGVIKSGFGKTPNGVIYTDSTNINEDTNEATLKTKNELGEELILYPRSKTFAISNDEGKDLDTILFELDERVTDSEFNDVYAETAISMGRKANTTVGRNSVAIGNNCEASGSESCAIGNNCTASQWCAHAEGDNSKATGYYSHVEGTGCEASGSSSHAENSYCIASGNSSHAEGNSSKAVGFASHAENNNCTATGDESHAEGDSTESVGRYSHVEGEDSKSIGTGSHAEGYGTKAEGDYSHAEGMYATTRSNASHAEGYSTLASGSNSHAEGYSSKATSSNAHAEGNNTQANGSESHAEGDNTQANSSASHAEGYGTKATNSNAHAEGYCTEAKGYTSHAEGQNTIAAGQYQHVQGQYNIEDTEDKYAHIVGGGNSSDERKNIHTLDWDGNAVFAGNVTNGNGATINGIETTTNNIISSGIDTPIVVNSLIGTFNQINTKGIQLYNFTDRTEVQNGITITFKDGIGTTTGTPTTNSSFSAIFDVYFEEIDRNTLVDGQSYEASDCILQITDINGNVADSIYYTYNATTDIKIVPHIKVMGYNYRDGATIKPCIYTGNDGTWETYTGGIPSPSPLFPQSLEYPLFTKININTEFESCSATSATQIMLCGMNDVFDKIVGNKLTKRYEKIILNGTEDIILDNITGCFLLTNVVTANAKPSSVNIASDNYKYFESNTYNTNYGIFILETGEIGIKHDGFSTVEEYKDWLVNNNVTIIYERDTEEIIVLDESFINEIKSLKIFVGENTITTNSETINPIIEFDYATSKMAKYVLDLLKRMEALELNTTVLSSILTSETF